MGKEWVTTSPGSGPPYVYNTSVRPRATGVGALDSVWLAVPPVAVPLGSVDRSRTADWLMAQACPACILPVMSTAANAARASKPAIEPARQRRGGCFLLAAAVLPLPSIAAPDVAWLAQKAGKGADAAPCRQTEWCVGETTDRRDSRCSVNTDSMWRRVTGAGKLSGVQNHALLCLAQHERLPHQFEQHKWPEGMERSLQDDEPAPANSLDA